MRFRYFNVNKKVDQLDGNGCLYLALQDVSLKNGDYLRAIDNKIAQVQISQLKFHEIHIYCKCSEMRYFPGNRSQLDNLY